MPRKGKGGRVEGVDQTAYSNRSDLNNRGPQPITAAPGEPYGQRKMLEDAQRAVPMGGTPSPPAVAKPTPSNTTPLNNAMTTAAQPPSNPEPGGIPFLHPTERPNEPITHGNDSSILPLPHQQTLGETLGNAAASPQATSAVVALAEFAKMLGI